MIALATATHPKLMRKRFNRFKTCISTKDNPMQWLRFYTDTLENLKIQKLPPNLFKAWVNFLCISKIFNGVLPDTETIAYRLHCAQKQIDHWRNELVSRRLIDRLPDGGFRMHDWDEHQYVSDNSTERVRKYRSKQAETASREADGNVGRRFRNGTDSETDSEAEADRAADADTKQNQNARSVVLAEWPETASAVREFFPASDNAIIVQIVHLSMQAYADVMDGCPAPNLSDAMVAEAVRTAHFEGQMSAGAFRAKVPRVIQTWAEQCIRG